MAAQDPDEKKLQLSQKVAARSAKQSARPSKIKTIDDSYNKKKNASGGGGGGKKKGFFNEERKSTKSHKANNSNANSGLSVKKGSGISKNKKNSGKFKGRK